MNWEKTHSLRCIEGEGKDAEQHTIVLKMDVVNHHESWMRNNGCGQGKVRACILLP